MQLLRNRKGFTLVELMVVVIIVLVLAGIAVPVYIHYIQEGKKSEGYATIDAIVSGALVYFQKHGTFDDGTETDLIDAYLARDDVDNARYFQYEVSDATGAGFTVTATVDNLTYEDWGPDGGELYWYHSEADIEEGDAGTGYFEESEHW
jgi:prepilin-type N-terminal cleavage/methylation domain-containing protein